MFKRNPKINRTKAILIEKKIYNSVDKQKEVSDLLGMRYGFYNEGDHTGPTKVYVLKFMTKKNIRTFLVDSSVYQQVHVDMLGTIEFKKDLLVRFEFIKEATKEDVNLL